jgi:phosphatidate phosphatase APP1
LRIVRGPVIKAYDGFGDEDEINVYGHVLKLSPLSRRHYRKNAIINLFALIRLFIVQPRKNGLVRIEFNGEVHEKRTEKDGFFRFEWKPVNKLNPGWQKAVLSYLSPLNGSVLAKAECQVFIPHEYQYSFISDIDDTFLISHSSSIFKRLYVLFTKNAQTRKPFDGVVRHYKLLSMAGASKEPNPFFYVSSSEWNLYDYIREFCRKQELPRGVFLLAQIKRISDLLNTGQGKHATKYIRIVRVLKSYPNHKYILLGDNSQKDPEIYATVTKDFPGMIHAVYIRNIRRSTEEATKKFIAEMEGRGVACCFFKHSSEAIEHSVRIGLIGK